jgi:hypothetical protein
LTEASTVLVQTEPKGSEPISCQLAVLRKAPYIQILGDFPAKAQPSLDSTSAMKSVDLSHIDRITFGRIYKYLESDQFEDNGPLYPGPEYRQAWLLEVISLWVAADFLLLQTLQDKVMDCFLEVIRWIDVCDFELLTRNLGGNIQLVPIPGGADHLLGSALCGLVADAQLHEHGVSADEWDEMMQEYHEHDPNITYAINRQLRGLGRSGDRVRDRQCLYHRHNPETPCRTVAHAAENASPHSTDQEGEWA